MFAVAGPDVVPYRSEKILLVKHAFYQTVFGAFFL